MPVSKTRKNARKTTKLYRMVTFTNELFTDDFTFPDFGQLSIGTIEALNNGDVGKVCAWLKEANVDDDSIDAFRTLSQDELQDFIGDWTDGNLADLPK
ncbi:hypothetical protein AL755_08495 [Arthrobacter sp. ERGS1:01]|uniref:hypothetical protein n=1 Tax=Arthrobacter sp. ERGS1:01 TaxID=1704044 RepID=UPI0006B4CADD|nr:hypothetical protein [Arthrobacter sp. ERGS1:01]ALE05509.1 hypothetical protein AL755_08495 [Arthrobacter sp. ERGS1:01]